MLTIKLVGEGGPFHHVLHVQHVKVSGILVFLGKQVEQVDLARRHAADVQFAFLLSFDDGEFTDIHVPSAFACKRSRGAPINSSLVIIADQWSRSLAIRHLTFHTLQI